MFPALILHVTTSFMLIYTSVYLFSRNPVHFQISLIERSPTKSLSVTEKSAAQVGTSAHCAGHCTPPFQPDKATPPPNVTSPTKTNGWNGPLKLMIAQPGANDSNANQERLAS